MTERDQGSSVPFSHLLAPATGLPISKDNPPGPKRKDWISQRLLEIEDLLDLHKAPENLTPTALLEDNASEDAQKGIGEWYRAKEKRKITLVASCGDARIEPVTLFDSTTIAAKRSIAAAGSPRPFRHLLNHDMINGIVVMQHYDGTTVEEDFPRGCGGLQAKSTLSHAEGDSPRGINLYIKERVASHHVVGQAWMSAARIIEETDKPILAAAVNHRTGYISPLVVVNEGLIRSAVDTSLFNDPKEIYRDGAVPEMDLEDLPEQFRELILRNREQTAKLQEFLPEFEEDQRVQDPRVITLTTSPIPPAVRYPATFSRPNLNFTLGIPFHKEEGHQIKARDLSEVLDQVEFPILESFEAQPGEPFSSTKVVLIETPSMALSRKVTDLFLQRPGVADWIGNKRGVVLTVEVQSGQTKNIRKYP